MKDPELADDGRDQALAHDIMAVHGPEAAKISRDNARAAALAGQPAQARAWIRVLGIIQTKLAKKISSLLP